MGRAISIRSGSTATRLSRPLAGLRRFLAAVWREAVRDVVQPYKPERHYMRGPGPAWQAKHGGKWPR